MKIDAAVSDDCDALAEIVAELDFLRKYNPEIFNPQTVAQRAIANGETLVARDEQDKPCGFIWFSTEGSLGRGGYIKFLAVSSEARGMGVGQMLMNEAEKEIAQRSLHAFLLTSHFNDRAQRFYERLGWSKVGELPDFAVDGICEFIYHKKLTKA